MFDATIFFCSRHNNVSSIQAESLLFNLKVISKEDYSKYFKNLRNVSSLLNILNCRCNYKYIYGKSRQIRRMLNLAERTKINL